MFRPCRLSVDELEAREVPAAPFPTLSELPFADHAVLDNARAIASLGRDLGRRSDAFLKIGDSNTTSAQFAPTQYLNPLGAAGYNATAAGLANYGPSMLQTLAAFHAPVDGSGANSFTRASGAAYPGWTLPIALPNVPGEMAATNAGIALVMIGTNDLAVYSNPFSYRAELESLVQTLTAAGVVPVLSTLPEHLDNPGYAPLVHAYNQAIADVGEQYRVPVWNYWRTLAALPGQGLSADGVHLSVSPNGGGSFTPTDLLFAQNVRSLQALQILDWFRTQVLGPPESVSPLPSWTSLDGSPSVYAVGRGAGQQPAVTIFDRATGQELNRFLAYESSFVGGVQVTLADVTGDGVLDVVTAPGSGGGPVVKAFDGTNGSLISSWMAYEPTFRTGVNVAAADLDGDGAAEVIVGAGNGGGPVVAVYRGGDLQEVARFYTYEPSFRGGVNVAAADLAGYGPSIVAGAGVGGGPVVKVFHLGSDEPLASFYVYDPSVRTGVFVAAGDVTGDGLGEIATSPALRSSHIRVLDSQSGSTLASFFAADPRVQGGIRLAIRDGKLLVGNGPGSAVVVKEYVNFTDAPAFLAPNLPGRAFGISVG